jgi:hypothetical protein
MVGPALAGAWLVTGRPHWFWPALFWVPDACIALVALMAPAGQRMHRFAVGVSGAFVAGGTARAAVALVALAEGTEHPGVWIKQLALGLLAAAFFGGGNLLGRRLWRPERTLNEDVAARITPPLKGQRSRRVWLTLGDGRRVPAVVAHRRQLAKLPSGVDARNVVDVQDR